MESYHDDIYLFFSHDDRELNIRHTLFMLESNPARMYALIEPIALCALLFIFYAYKSPRKVPFFASNKDLLFLII